MRQKIKFKNRCFLFFSCLFVIGAVCAHAVEFHIQYKPGIRSEPVSCRVYLLLDGDTKRNPLHDPDVRRKQPFFALDVKDWKAGETIVLDHRAPAWPVNMNALKGTYVIGAVMDIDTTERSFLAPGNGYSRKIIREIRGGKDEVITITIDRTFKEPVFKETSLTKEVGLKSKLLSDFYGRPIIMKAAIILPPSYLENPGRLYPAVYTVGGFSSRYYHISVGRWNQNRFQMNKMGLDKVFVFLDADCPTGNHAFADSENNGPRARALVEELIPYIEKKYRVIPGASARLLTGQSSGAWTCMWLQVNYPGTFGGAWAVSPDPLDFRNFCGINLYTDTNMFFDKTGKLRPLGRAGGKIILTVKDVSDMEAVLGPGGFLNTFEGVFSRRDKNGNPEPLWNRKTGEIDKNVLKIWEKYDIQSIMEKNWSTLGPCLAGKLHVYVAEDDAFFLDQSVKCFKAAMEKLGSDAEFVILPTGGHGDGVWRQVIKGIHQSMDERLLKHHPELKSL